MMLKKWLITAITVIITGLTFSTTIVYAASPLAGQSSSTISTVLNDFNTNVTDRYKYYDPNLYLSNSNYAEGTKVKYVASNTSLQYTKFPTGETSSRYGKQTIKLGSKGTVIYRKASDWDVVYYLVKFNNYKRLYWIISSSLYLQKNPNKNNTNVSDTINENSDFNYVNYLRYRNGIAPLTWNNDLYQLSQARNQQNIQLGVDHYNSDGSWRVDGLAKEFGFSDYVLRENIQSRISTDTPVTTTINMINEYMYDDAVGENWGHRANILGTNISQMATATTYYQGMYYNTMLFE
ncbi:CAP domain-containing protein [Lactobacillus sp. Sy-1]|uniref:CAP domain-containing protein n=1 Tax=Lactobacillus sp. Sy-1 TaxID=2109645 RepID=UPI001C5B0D01|nr:CAP domain-containing protein [Lactobacillus sp. Sy-1]MBW1606085.1 hypothetical protein [Lactobacillus sp. Sy-1]